MPGPRQRVTEYRKQFKDQKHFGASGLFVSGKPPAALCVTKAFAVPGIQGSTAKRTEKKPHGLEKGEKAPCRGFHHGRAFYTCKKLPPTGERPAGTVVRMDSFQTHQRGIGTGQHRRRRTDVLQTESPARTGGRDDGQRGRGAGLRKSAPSKRARRKRP